jgi:NadR type nicotinamide-nucleotide adenylyltransferase
MKILEKPKIIVITGAESTGKSVLTSYLGHFFTSPWYPEYAREYLEKSGPVYSRHDVETIAHVQYEQMEEALKLDAHFVFFDTWLIITKIWMEVVYGECPVWISQAISSAPVDIFLLCNTDIPWIPDPFRENGGEMREKLSAMYRENLIHYGLNFSIISGKGEERFACARKIIQQLS